jgi:hypothetical protein
MCGRVRDVVMRVQPRPIPPQLLDAETQDRPRYRVLVERWVGSIWREKDQLLTTLATQTPSHD